MDDAELDRTLRAALSVSPSPEFVSRVRQTIAERPHAPVSAGWLKVAAAAAAAVVVLTLLRGQLPTTGTAQTDSISTLASTVSFGTPTQAPAVTRPHPYSADRGRPTAPSHFDPAFPEVLIAADERRALQNLICGARERRFEATFEDTAPPVPWATIELTVAPITIEPLAPAANNN